ncbi:MAG: SDR family NAD(P)-dependent oxidoreductase, partial [Chloroflexi bacterium]|nr:SDR family NAD(P)-dependent oxidoreductase [Chloroflexota bacterium]
MDLNLKGKVAIVTGAGGGGIGTRACLGLAREGVSVVANDIDRSWADRVAKEVRGQGVKAMAAYADVASLAGCTDVVSKALAEFGKIDILVTIPAYMGYQAFSSCSAEELHRIVDVTFWGVVNAVKAVLPAMMKERAGSIVCMGSDSAKMAPPGEVMYASSKAAIMTFASSLAKEIGSYQVRINVVNAALVRTPGQAGMEYSFSSNYPLGRLAESDEVADAIVFLAS